MTFSEYWAKNEPFGCNPEDVAKLAWDAAIEQCVKTAERSVGLTGQRIAALIRIRYRSAPRRGNPDAS